MTTYLIWSYLHILMFVFWVGTDMGVFLSCKKATDPKLPFESRVLLLHMALRIELLPRTMWKAALPLGMMLSNQLGLVEVSTLGLAAIWVLSILWWILSMYGAWYYDQPKGMKAGHINNWITGVVGVSLIAVAIASAMGMGPFDPDATWLLWKIGIYGFINLTIVAMLAVFDPMGIAFYRLGTEGSTPEIEGIIKSTMTRATVTIWTTYILILIVGFIGTTKII